MRGMVNLSRVFVTALTGNFRKSEYVVNGVDDRRHCILKSAHNTSIDKVLEKGLDAIFGPSILHDGRKEASRYIEIHPPGYQQSL